MCGITTIIIEHDRIQRDRMGGLTYKNIIEHRLMKLLENQTNALKEIDQEVKIKKSIRYLSVARWSKLFEVER